MDHHETQSIEVLKIFGDYFFSDFCCVYQLKKIGLDFQPQLMICVYAMFKVLSVTQWQIPLTVILSEVIQCSRRCVYLEGGTAAAAHSEVSPFPPHNTMYCYTTYLGGGKKSTATLLLLEISINSAASLSWC